MIEVEIEACRITLKSYPSKTYDKRERLLALHLFRFHFVVGDEVGVEIEVRRITLKPYPSKKYDKRERLLALYLFRFQFVVGDEVEVEVEIEACRITLKPCPLKHTTKERGYLHFIFFDSSLKLKLKPVSLRRSHTCQNVRQKREVTSTSSFSIPVCCW